jgi:hypothetical protein
VAGIELAIVCAAVHAADATSRPWWLRPGVR